MNDDLTIPIAHRYDHDRATDWLPLERFSAVTARQPGVPTIDPDDFMWMGAATFADGLVVHAYKHCDTRRYLHLDGSGHAYRYEATAAGGRYLPIGSPAEAVEHVLDRKMRQLR